MPYLSVDDQSTTIAITGSGNICTFTVATADASLVENNPNRVTVTETAIRWSILPDRIIKAGTSAATTGLSIGTEDGSYSEETITTDVQYWTPLTSVTDATVLKALITAQYKDTTLELSRGAAVTDLNIPDNIGTDGFASDGAWHFEADNNDDLEIPWDRDRNNPNVQIHDWPMLSGSGDEHLIGHWKLNSVGGSSDFYEEIAAEWGGTSNNVTAVEAVQGNGIQKSSGTSDYFEVDDTNIPTEQGTISFWFIPSHDSDNAVFWTAISNICSISEGDNANTIGLKGNNGSGANFEWEWHIRDNGGTAHTCDSGLLSANIFTAGTPLRIHLCWDSAKGFMAIIVNNRIVKNLHTSSWTMGESWQSSDGNLRFFNDSGGEADTSIIDSLKIYNQPILPYGAYFTGNGSVNTARAHSDVLTYWDCDNTTLNISQETTPAVVQGGATFTGGGVEVLTGDTTNITCTDGTSFDMTNSTISLWYKATGSPAAWACLCALSSSSNAFLLMMETATKLTLKINGYQYGVTVPTLWDGNDHHIRFNWDLGTYNWHLWLDGIYYPVTGFSNFTDPTASGPMYIGNVNGAQPAQGVIRDFHITSKKDTPQIPTIGYKPMWMPTVQGKTLGTDYQQSVLPDMSVLLTHQETLTTADTTYITHLHPDVGKWVRDLNIPASIGKGGLASDGAYHAEMGLTDGDPQLQLTADIDRNNMALAPHQNEAWGMKTVNDAGSALDEHLICYWSCASLTVLDIFDASTDGGTVTLTGVDVNTDGIRGKAVGDFTDASDIATFPCTDGSNVVADRGTITFSYKNNGSTPAGYNRFFEHSLGSTNALQLLRNSTFNDRFEVQVGNTGALTGSDFGTDLLDGNWHSITMGWDQAKSFIYISLNGVVHVHSVAFTAPTLSSGTMQIGNRSSGSRQCEGLIDNFKIYNELILPYGAYFTGIGSDSTDLAAVNTNTAHSDVTCYFDSEIDTVAALQIGTSTLFSIDSTISIATSGGPDGKDCLNFTTKTATSSQALEIDGTDIDLSNSSFGFWYSPQYTGIPTTSQNILFNSGEISLTHNITSGDLVLACGVNGGITESAWSPVAGVWYFIRFNLETNNLKMFIDDIQISTTDNVYTAPSAPAVIEFGRTYQGAAAHNYYLGKIYITSNPNTPQLRTAGYRPIVLPVVDIT
ncbi:MAG: hypothetical protein GQ540_03740 [Lutibacter sp.]|uniref:LamG-like jellyroll fold domain-containing protein n=1 Tax=Lutibacter sp. TaxID=1925666 RepID=UPI0019E0F030|nr:LamG-like jellyroll fold domain-containing protein [Lutibacter sp.]NOR27625.1 hypothetical protein [Lutibacter sp.]